MKFDPSKPVQTRDGRKARIICSDVKGAMHSIIALISDGNFETAYEYNYLGECTNSNSPWLINIPENHVSYFNTYNGELGDIEYKSVSDAKAGASQGITGRVRVEFQEGQFDE